MLVPKDTKEITSHHRIWLEQYGGGIFLSLKYDTRYNRVRDDIRQCVGIISPT